MIRRLLRVRIGHRRRGMTLIELMVGLIIIATAAVGASIAIFNAYGQLQRQRHRLMANHYLRAEVEYWQGRIHSAFPTSTEIFNAAPPKQVILDPKDPTNGRDDIVATVRRQAMIPRRMNYANQYFYWEIPVTITWIEPTWAIGGGTDDAEVTYTLVGYWMQSEAAGEDE